MKINTNKIVKIAVVTAVYVALTYACAPLSYGAVQFRIAESLMLLCLYKSDYCVSLVIGCFISNIGSPLGIVDMFFGTLATVLSVVCIRFLAKAFENKKTSSVLVKIIASFFPVIFNAIIIGLEICIMSPLDSIFWIQAGFVALGEFVCVTVLGTVLFELLEKNKSFMKIFM